MKKALIFMMQPPGCAGIQAYRMFKILPFMEKYGWELHFVGPDPSVTSLYLEPVLRGNKICHYTRDIAFSQYFSVKRNRIKGQSPVKIFYGGCQAVSLILERVFRFDAYKYLEKGMIEQATKALGQHDYQLIAGLCPDFKILKTAYAFALFHRKPLIAIYDDPHGARWEGQFYPAEPEKQREILDFASGAIFASPLTHDRYVEQKLVTAKKTFVMHDSFPDIPDREEAGDRDLQKLNMVHLGNLPAYRPIDSLLEALEEFRAKPENPKLRIDFYGYVYPEAIRKIKNSASFSQAIHIHKEVTHSQSHEIAGRTDVLLVVIGPRHIDNCPSKFFEYLCHSKPVFVVGPKGNPIEGIVETLGIGKYSDINDAQAIFNGIISIVKNYDNYRMAYEKNKNLIQEYSAENTAYKWAQVLDKIQGEI